METAVQKAQFSQIWAGRGYIGADSAQKEPKISTKDRSLAWATRFKERHFYFEIAVAETKSHGKSLQVPQREKTLPWSFGQVPTSKVTPEDMGCQTTAQTDVAQSKKICIHAGQLWGGRGFTLEVLDRLAWEQPALLVEDKGTAGELPHSLQHTGNSRDAQHMNWQSLPFPLPVCRVFFLLRFQNCLNFWTKMLDVRKNFFWESGDALKQTAQGGGGITATGGVQETCHMALRDVVSRHGLTVGWSWWPFQP